DFLKEMRTVLEDEAREYGIKLFNRLPLSDDMVCDKDTSEHFTKELFCTLPWEYMYILSGGAVIPHGHCKKVIGNVETESVMDIWNSPDMQTYRKKLLQNDYHEWCGEKTHWMYLM
ncbi:SPASM domain-containing protein, partial [Elusimicrobiota bacterium]